MGVLGKDDVIKILQNLKQLFNDNKDLLVELDSRMGDGDLGLTMSKAFSAAADDLVVQRCVKGQRRVVGVHDDV